MKNLYDQSYYEHGIESGISLYSNYRWLPELTIPLAARIIEYLQIGVEDSILDFGCAKGYLIKAFRLLHRNAYGFDISSYAIDNAPKEIGDYIYSDFDKVGNYDWIISKDVFEHISYEEIDRWIREISEKCKRMFAIVPLGENGQYIVPAYELDKTHCIRQDLNWWKEKFEENSFTVEKALYKVDYIKENWCEWEKGNGFFVCKSNVNR